MLNLYYHFHDLKQRFTYLVLSCFFLLITSFLKSNSILFFYLEPFLLKNKEIFFFNPLESIFFHFVLYFHCFLICFLPYLFFIVGSYLKPGLFKLEKNFLFSTIFYLSIISVLLLLLFSSFLLPTIFDFFLSFENFQFQNSFFLKFNLNGVASIIFCIQIYYCLLIACNIPLFLFYCIFFQFLSVHFFLRNRKGCFLCCLLLASFLGPPDIFSQCSLCLFLFCVIEVILFLSIVVSLYHFTESCSNGNEVSLLNLSLLTLIE